jgi:hypothetical protein
MTETNTTSAIVVDVVFLFGAGASYGADDGQVSPERLPLMREVYTRLAKRFPSQWGASSERARFASDYTKDFERTFTVFDLKRHPDRPPGVQGLPGSLAIEAQRPLAIYFSELRLDTNGRDLYSRLLRFLKQSEIIDSSFFATLNYDCLFEQAVYHQRLGLDYLMNPARQQLQATSGDDWPGRRMQDVQVYLAKLHGSCNFAMPQREIDFFRLHASMPGGYVGTGIDTLGAFPQLPHSETDIWPIMTQTSPDRDDFAGGTLLTQFRNMWGMAARQAKLLVIIGAAAREYDTHVWDPVKAAVGDVVYIGLESDLAGWRRCNPGVRFLSKDFQAGFRRLLRQLARNKKRRGGTTRGYLMDLLRACWF